MSMVCEATRGLWFKSTWGYLSHQSDIMSSQINAIFQGVPPSDSRNALGEFIKKNVKDYNTFVVPCAGRFAAAETMVKTGADPGAMLTSDISLFSCIMGKYITGEDLNDLDIKINDPDVSFLTSYFNGGLDHAAASLLAIKYAITADKNHYLRAIKKEMLKQLFDAIEDLEARIETALDPKDLEFEVPDRIPIPEMALGLEFKHVSMMFLPHQLKSFEEVVKRISGDEELIAAAPLELFDDFKKAVNATQEMENIVSIGTTIAFMTELTNKYLDEMREKANEESEGSGENETSGETGGAEETSETEKVPEKES